MIRELMRTYGSNATDAGYDATDFLGIPEYERAIHTIVTIRGDPGYMRYNAAKGIIEALMSAYIQAVSAKVLAEVQPYLPEGINIRLHEPHVVTDEAIVGVSTLSVFDYQVPGLMVFAILMGITGVAVTLTVEVHNKTLERLKITKMRAFDLMFGTLIPFTALSALQILILFFVALLMGYHWHPAGNPGFAILIGMLAAIASVALGLILASFAKNENQAATLGPMIAVPTAFLTGAFFPLPKVMLTDNFFGTGKPFYLFDWLPWTQASYAIMQILTFGKPITALYFELVLMIILIVIFFTIGVVLYSKKRLKSSD
jgi:ABC-2 type transport system permease protein